MATSPVNPIRQAPPARRLWRSLGRLAGGLLFLGLLASAAGYWLLMTHSGARQVAQWLNASSQGAIQLQGIQGRLAGPLQLQGLVLQTAAGTAPLRLHELKLAWQPGALLERRLHISQLSIQRLQLPGTSDSPLELPRDLRLPLAIHVAALDIGRIETPDASDAALLHDLRAELDSDGQRHRLSLKHARWQAHSLSAKATLQGQAPFSVSAQARLLSQAMQQGDSVLPPVEVTAHLTGTLDALRLRLQGAPQLQTAQATAGSGQPGSSRDDLRLSADLALSPFAPQLLRHAQLSARHLDPQRFHGQLPHADLTLDIDLKPGADRGLMGSLRLENSRPAPLNLKGLPLNQLSSQLAIRWPTKPPASTPPDSAAGDYRIDFESLLVSASHSRIQGTLSLNWPAAHPAAAKAHGTLQLHDIDPALWHDELRPMRLQGRLAFQGDQQQQQADLRLTDGRMQLATHVDLDAQTVRLSQFELRQGEASLGARGELQRHAPHAWQVSGQLERIDPAQFAHLPEASLNARFTSRGLWRGRSAGELTLTLDNSQLAGQALELQAELGFIGLEQPAHLLSANGQAQLRGKIRLAMAGSRVDLQGGWGRASDTLAMHLDLPDLARHRQFLQQLTRWAQLPEIEGMNAFEQLAGRVLIDASLTGFPKRPQIRLNSRAERLALPSGLRVDEFSAQGALDDARLDLELQVEGLHPRAASQEAIERLQLKFSGEREQHQLQLDASYRQQQLTLAASGGLVAAADWRDTGWQGQLSQLSVALGPQPPPLLALLRELRLQAPAAVKLNRRALDLGAARLRVAGGDLELQNTHWSPAGWQSTGRFANVHLQANQPTAARAAGRWSLAGSASNEMHGLLRAQIPDLRGVAAAFNPRLTSAGALAIDLNLAGTTSSPQLQGTLRGNELALGFPEHNLQLMNGTLDLELSGSQARLNKLSFRAPYQARPRALRAVGYHPERAYGELNIQGSFDLEQQRASLSARLTQLPLTQRQDRWLVVSGQGELMQSGWQSTLRAALTTDAGFISGLLLNQPQLADDIVILGQEAKAGSKLHLDSDIQLDLGEHFHLNAAGLTARLAGQIHLRGSPLRATGSIMAQDASYTAYGQRLQVERGIVNFQGPLENPGLNVLALRKGEAVEAGVSITGSVKRPHIQLVSTPEVPDSEKLSWIVLGRLPDSGGNDAGLLLSAAGSILGQDGADLATRIADSFGLDEFSLRKGRSGDTLDNQILSLGKRLSARAYLNYEQGLSAAQGTLKLSYTLSRSLKLVTRAGIDAAVDVFYTLKLD